MTNCRSFNRTVTFLRITIKTTFFSIFKVYSQKQSAQHPLTGTQKQMVQCADNPNFKDVVHLILTPDVTLILKARVHHISVPDKNQCWRCVTCTCLCARVCFMSMTIKCWSVYLSIRTHDVVDAKRFKEMQKCSEILTDKGMCSWATCPDIQNPHLK